MMSENTLAQGGVKAVDLIGIVLIDHVNQLRAGGLSRHDAIVRGGGDPPCFPMARAIAGGLAFATAVTLVLLPEVYVLLDDLRPWYWRTVRTAFGWISNRARGHVTKGHDARRGGRLALRLDPLPLALWVARVAPAYRPRGLARDVARL
jgi:hypothetical protein